MHHGLVFMLTLIAGLLMAPSAIAEEAPGSQQPVELNKQVPVKMNYLLYLPENYEEQDEWPLMLFLHGAGERGDDLEKVKKHGPPKLIKQGKQFPFIVVSPQCPSNRWWQPFELSALLDEVISTHKVDDDRVYLSGLSMGGFGSWNLAAYTPGRFAAVAPICGGGEPFWARLLRDIPFWVFHGAKDPVVPLERSQVMVDALKQKKGDVRFTVYPDAGHDSWTETYDNPEFYEWMLEQERPSRHVSIRRL